MISIQNVVNDVILTVETLALSWNTLRLIRKPRDRALAWITLCLLAAVVANIVAWRGVKSWIEATVAPGASPILENLFLMLLLYALMCFFTYSLHRDKPERMSIESVRRRVRIDAGLFVIVAVAAGTALIITPPKLRGAGYYLTVPGVTAFYLVVNVYFAYVSIVAVRMALAVARTTEPETPRSAIGVRLIAAGLAFSVVGGPGNRIASVIAHGLGATLSQAIEIIASILLNGGILVFMAGVVYTGVVRIIATLWVWIQDRRAYVELEQLWTPLLALFPDNELADSPFFLRGSCRATETRDCLDELGPYLLPITGDHPPTIEQEALRVRAGLRRKAAGLPPVAGAGEFHPVRVATPPVIGYAAEIDTLVSLARAFARLSSDSDNLAGRD